MAQNLGNLFDNAADGSGDSDGPGRMHGNLQNIEDAAANKKERLLRNA